MSAADHRSSLSRARAWLVTGPLGHLYGAAADLTELVGRGAVRRLGRRSDPEG